MRPPAATQRKDIRKIPCWFTSMVVHVAVLTLITSLAAQRGSTRVAPLTLMGGIRETDTLTSAPIQVTVPQAPADEIAQDARAAGEEPAPTERPPQPATAAEPAPADTPPEPTLAEPVAAPTPPSRPMLISETGNIKIARRLSDVNLTEVSRLLVQAKDSPKESTSSPQRAVDKRRRQAEHTRIVAQFIEYDVGRLRGEEGLAARQAFMALGPEAIPALVRGLNQSAEISASCPVMVIANKLLHTLRVANDSRMFRHALTHLGDDVSPSAPHRNYLQQTYRQIQDLADGNDGSGVVAARRAAGERRRSARPARQEPSARGPSVPGAASR